MTMPVNCGCAGKTALDTIVRPARRQLHNQLRAEQVRLGGDLDAGLLPNADRFDRALITGEPGSATTLENTDSKSSHDSDRSWAVTATLAGGGDGTSAVRFTSTLAAAATDLEPATPVTLAKGHAIQLPGADASQHISETFTPAGTPRSGLLAVNVDLIHAFPELPHPTQAGIAASHALNDVYAAGATVDQTVRPIIAVPANANRPPTDVVTDWFTRVIPDVELYRPVVVSHTGDGWAYGATATARLTHAPPIYRSRLAPGDCVLLHRPLGAVAWYAQAARDGNDASMRAARTHLHADHEPIAALIREFSPDTPAAFDPTQHIKLAVDISGPGIQGLGREAARGGCHLQLTTLPFLNEDAVNAARADWLLPDATIGTNGPLAMFARPQVATRIHTQLNNRGYNPTIIGRLQPSKSTAITAPGIPLEQYVESTALNREHTKRKTDPEVNDG